MKNLFTLLVITFLAGTAGMNAQQAAKTVNPDKTRSIMIYSEEDEALVYKNSPSNTSNEIIIASLPGYGSDPVPVEINQNKKGSYTFKKDPTLLLPEYYTIVIADSLTGATFDLKAADSYTFDVAKATPDRFVLLMSKSKTIQTAML